jgi:Protein of unknown function (DUF1260).
MKNWPDDADGDVFRSLEADGCDFSKEYTVDFFVDFEEWPPSAEALAALQGEYGNIAVKDDDEEELPCLICKIDGLLTYEFVTGTQAKITDLVKPFGGYCMDWGVQI